MPEIAPDRPVFAIGDVHGRADLLIALLERILEDSADLSAPPEVVFLGDYVDRGENSRDTLELLSTVSAWPEIDPVFLMGNHEQMLLRFLDAPEEGQRWFRVGGLQTLLSYGVGAYEGMQDPDELAQVRDELAEALGAHQDFIEDLRLCHLNGNVFFTHAGADPALAPAAQDPRALLWGHPEFARMPRGDGLWVVHGHTVVEAPSVEGGRIALDTGAYFSGRLTAARLEPGRIRFLNSGPDAG
ncbi:MAG: metallophosphoesterase family protein [Paracoccaceae bacterium]